MKLGLHNQRMFLTVCADSLMEAHLRARRPRQGLDLTTVKRRNSLQWEMLTFNGHWHAGEVCSSQMNPGFNCTEQMADSVYDIVWASGLLMSML